MNQAHLPVLPTIALSVLSPSSGDRMLDCTLGLGGHAALFLEAASPDGMLTGLDADEENLQAARVKLSAFEGRIRLVHANFAELPECLPEDARVFDVIFADLGLSSPHLDDATRGFTFHGNAPLDMRYDRTRGTTASALLMTATKDELTSVFQNYGELPKTHRFVRAILDARSGSAIATADDLRLIAEPLYGPTLRDALPLIFQALRIAVNDELGALSRLLTVAPTMLAPAGRFAVISYHSLEDRLVKRAFRSLVTPDKDPVTGAPLSAPAYEVLTKKAFVPDDEEKRRNPRSRSAKLRAIRKLPLPHSPC